MNKIIILLFTLGIITLLIPTAQADHQPTLESKTLEERIHALEHSRTIQGLILMDNKRGNDHQEARYWDVEKPALDTIKTDLASAQRSIQTNAADINSFGQLFTSITNQLLNDVAVVVLDVSALQNKIVEHRGYIDILWNRMIYP